MSNQESGVPGGWGSVEGGSEGGQVTSGGGDGTYTDAQGKQITKEQAQAQGTVDKPGDAASKLAQIGGNQRIGETSVSRNLGGIEEMKASELKAAQEQKAFAQSQIQKQAEQFQNISRIEAMKAAELQNLQARQTIGQIEQREGARFENLSQEQLQNLSSSEKQKLVDAGFLRESQRVAEKPPTQKEFDFTGRTTFEGERVSMTPEEIENQKLPSLRDFGISKPPSLFSEKQETKKIYVKGIGWFIPKEVAEQKQAKNEQDLLSGYIPKDVTPSWIAKKSMSIADSVAKEIRGLTVDTSKVPTEIKESAGFKGTQFVVPRVRESVARLVEFGGIVEPTAELFGKTAIKEPSKVPEMLVVGGISMVGGIAKQAEKDPSQLVSDILVSRKLFDVGGKIKTKVGETIKFTGKTYVPPETIMEPQIISGAERFPTATKGTTGAQLLKEFETSKYRIPGTEEKTGGWHATPQEFAKSTETQMGSSESPGMYIAPSTSPHFLKISPKESKLFGLGGEPSAPAAIFLETKEITRAPKGVRKDISEFNKFILSEAEKGKAFISSAFEKGMKPEKEAIIPPDTPIERTGFKYYTKWEGKKVPIMEYTTKTTSTVEIPKETKTFGELGKSQSKAYSEYRDYQKPIFTPSSFVLLSSEGSPLKSTKSYVPPTINESRISVVKEQISNIKSTISSGAKSNIPSGIKSIISGEKPSTTTPTISEISYKNTIYPKQPAFPRPYLDRFYNEELNSEIPVDVVYAMNGDGETSKKVKRKHQVKPSYVYKYRPSPIYGGASKLFETPKQDNPLGTGKKSSKARKVVRHTTNTFYFGGLSEFSQNPVEKTKKVYKGKKTNKNINKKPSWL